MFTRTTGLLIVPLWLAAMGWLVAHDVWPAWTAQEPPRLRPTDWLKGEGKQAQFAVYCDNTRVGTIWTSHIVDEEAILKRDIILIERFPIAIAPMRATVDATFTGEGLLDELDVRLSNRDAQLRLHGERFHADFSFTLESGSTERAFKIPLIDGDMIAEAFNPFAQLTDVHVGQTWRMQVFNPIAALTGVGDRFTSFLVKVTGEETISTPDGARRCLVAQAPGAKAWIDSRGVVLVQEMTLPLAGRMRIVRLPEFDQEAMTEAQKRVFH